MSLSQLDVHPKTLSSLLKAHITDVKKLLSYSKYELEKKAGLSENEVADVLHVAAQHSVNLTSFRTAAQICSKPENAAEFVRFKLSTGCSMLDKKLKGGLLYPGITEISGESASGKTQLCIQLCLNAQIKNRDMKTGSVYICTEDAFPNKRLNQMALLFFKKNYAKLQCAQLSQITDQIFIEHASDLDDLMTLLSIRLPAILSKNHIRLIVLDSIAALFRVEFDSWQMAERARILAKVGSLLHKLSHKFNVCIVCVNQVSAKLNGSDSREDNKNQKVIPALGLTWSYCVNTRIMLSRTHWTTSMFKAQHEAETTSVSINSVVRSLSIIFSPHLPQFTSYFIVEQEGIKDFTGPIE